MRFEFDRLFKQGGAGVVFNQEHPRQPKYSPGGIGGQFAPKDEELSAAPARPWASDLTSYAFGGLALITERGKVKAALRVLRDVAMSVGSVRTLAIHALFDALNPSLWKNVEDGVAHVRAAKDFAGGKTIEEIIEHPGGPGYKLHHFLEDTAENRANLPPGYRDLPEHKGYIPAFAHEDVPAELSSKDVSSGTGQVRDSFRNLSPERQKEKMFEIMRKKGILK